MATATAPVSRRLTTHDASFLYTETPTGPMHGGSVGIFEGEFGMDTLVESMATRLHLAPRYRQRLAFVPYNLHHPTWEDDEKLRHPQPHLGGEAAAQDEPGGRDRAGGGPGRAVARPLAADVEDGPALRRAQPHPRPLDGAPLDYFDGVSGVELSTVLLDFEPEAEPPPPPETAMGTRPVPLGRRAPLGGGAQRAQEQLVDIFRASNLLLDLARAGAPGGGR